MEECARERERANVQANTADAMDLQAIRAKELAVLSKEAEEAREGLRQAETARSQTEVELLMTKAKLAQRDQELIIKSGEAFAAITAAERAEDQVRELRAAKTIADVERETERIAFTRAHEELEQLAAHREDQFNACLLYTSDAADE